MLATKELPHSHKPIAEMKVKDSFEGLECYKMGSRVEGLLRTIEYCRLEKKMDESIKEYILGRKVEERGIKRWKHRTHLGMQN